MDSENILLPSNPQDTDSFSEDLQAALGDEWNSFSWNDGEREALVAQWLSFIHQPKSNPKKARQQILQYATFLKQRRLKPEESPAEAVEDGRASQVDDGGMPKSNLSKVEGRGWRGDKGFRTLCLAAAVKALKDAPFRLLAYLLSRGDSDGGNCFPSRRRIRSDLDWNKNKVGKWLKFLGEEGWIEPIRLMDKSGRHTSSLYRFRIPPGSMKGEEEWREGTLCWDQRVGVVPMDEDSVATIMNST